MNDRDALLDQRDDLARVLRELNDAAIAARPHVEEAQGWYRSILLDDKERTATEVIERLDGAIADAGHVLEGVRS